MSRYDHKIETFLEGTEHLSKGNIILYKRRKIVKNHYYLREPKIGSNISVLE